MMGACREELHEIRTEDGGTFLALKSLGEGELKAILEAHRENSDPDRFLKKRMGTVVTRIPLPPHAAAGLQASPEAVVKEAPLSWRRRALRFLGIPSPFSGDFAKVRRLEAMGFPAPRTLAASLRSLGKTEFLVTEFLRAGVALRDLTWCGSSAIEDPVELESLFSELGAWLRKVHDRGVWHRDLKTGNIMVRREASGPREFILVDLVAVRFFRRSLGARRRARNLGQVLDLPGRFDSLARRPLLEAYAGAAPAGRDLERLVDRAVRARRRYRKRKCGFAYVDQEHSSGAKP